MMNLLSLKITEIFLSEKIISDEDIDIYVYGFEMVISNIITVIITILTGVLFGNLFDAFIFYTVFSSTRRFSGGYHASTYIGCKITYIICIVSVMLLANTFLFLSQFLQFHFLILLICLFNIITVSILSPIEHKNKPLTKKDKRINKIRSIFVSMSWLAIAFAPIWWGSNIIHVILLTQFSISILIFKCAFAKV
ncbi:MAG: accessory gene regulator B family protein [Eubacterium sp.]|nr:accessory gene regulator B family protein [Eubacterium sp.]